MKKFRFKINISNFFRDFIKVAFSNYFAQGISAVISIILARFLGPAGFGAFSLGFYALTIFGTSLQGFDQVYVYSFIQSKEKKEKIRSTYIVSKLFIYLFVISVFILIFLYYLFFKQDIGQFKFVVIGIIFSLGFHIFQTFIFIYQSENRFNMLSFTRIFYYILLLLFTILGIIFRVKSFYFYIFIYLISGIILLFLKENQRKLSNIYFYKDTFNELLRIGKWLILYEVLAMLNYRLDFFWLSKYFSGDDLGIYSVAGRLQNIFVLLVSSFPALLLPKVSEIDTVQKFKNYWRTVKKMTLFLIVSWAIIFIISPFIVTTLFGKAYEGSIKIFQVLLLASFPLILTLSIKYIFLSMKKTYLLVIICLTDTLTISIFVPFLCKTFGIIGAAYSVAITMSINASLYLFFYIINRKKYIYELDKTI